MTICIVDTSVFCNILAIPGRDQHHREMVQQLQEHVNENVSLLLPLAVIFETGNHIAQIKGNGNRRRKAAKTFVKQVQEALEGEAPWTPTPNLSPEMLSATLEEFPDRAMRGIGLVDGTIIDLFDHQRELHPERRVFIWSLDSDLKSHDRDPGRRILRRLPSRK